MSRRTSSPAKRKRRARDLSRDPGRYVVFIPREDFDAFLLNVLPAALPFATDDGPDVIRIPQADAPEPITIFRLLTTVVMQTSPFQLAILERAFHARWNPASVWQAASPCGETTRTRSSREPAAGESTTGKEGGVTPPLETIGISMKPGAPTGKDVKVAVLDTGVAQDHPDFKGRIKESETFVPGQSVQDRNGHGTHVASLIGAKDTTTALGTRYSVAPECELYIAKVLTDGTAVGTDEWILDGLQWAVAKMNVDIVALALTSGRGRNKPPADAYDALFESHSKTVLFVGAAGNGTDYKEDALRAPIGDPAASPFVLAVGATNAAGDALAGFSAGDDDIAAIDFIAPGIDCLSAWKDGRWRRLSGTSSSCAYVTGLAALFAKDGKRGDELRKVMVDAGARARPDMGFGIPKIKYL